MTPIDPRSVEISAQITKYQVKTTPEDRHFMVLTNGRILKNNFSLFLRILGKKCDPIRFFHPRDTGKKKLFLFLPFLFLFIFEMFCPVGQKDIFNWPVSLGWKNCIGS